MTEADRFDQDPTLPPVPDRTGTPIPHDPGVATRRNNLRETRPS